MNSKKKHEASFKRKNTKQALNEKTRNEHTNENKSKTVNGKHNDMYVLSISRHGLFLTF